MKSSIEELIAFVTIIDSGAIVAAAAQLDQTTSGISRALQRLESKLGVTLLERTTRKISLTQEGQIFLEKARQILLDLEAAEDALQTFDQEISGLIRIDSATPFILHVVAPLIQEFMQLYPAIEIEMNTSDQMIDLLEQRTDVAIRIGELQNSSLHAKLLCRSRLYIVASPEYLATRGYPKRPEELHQHDLIGFSKISSLNTWPLKSHDGWLTVNPKLKLSNGEAIRQLALLGNGITCLSEFVVSKDLKHGRLVALLEDENIITYQTIHAVYYQQDHLPKRVRIFIEFLAEKLKRYRDI